MDIASIEQHLARYAQDADESVVGHVRSFLDWIKGEEQAIAAEVAHLKARGYQILNPKGESQ